MISLETVQQTWRILEHAIITEGTLPVSEMNIELPDGPPALTVDNTGSRHLLIPTSTPEEAVEDQRSSGVQILINEWQVQGSRRPFIDIICLRPELSDLFDLVLVDILNELSTDSTNPNRTARLVLNRWRDFFSKPRGTLPTERTLTGIFGELSILLELAKHNPDAAESWVGPEGAQHDFKSGHLAMEVKTSRQRESRMIKIHSLDQLDISVEKRLYLVLLQLEKVVNAGLSIKDLINGLSRAGVDMNHIQRLLIAEGLYPDMISQTDSLRFEILETLVYEVDEQFPRITVNSFTEGKLPNGVASLEYVIDLLTEPPFPLAQDAVNNLMNQFSQGISQ